MSLSDLPALLGLILVVVMLFNVMIFVHELGHFWAARWRGLRVDRFQIWFGKPLWKKERNGVQYGLGWIPLGGFVSLPQMSPMETIEGKSLDDGEKKPAGNGAEAEPRGGAQAPSSLPPVSPLDKIIVAFAGPLFSFLLAVLAALVLWKTGKPADVISSTVIGHIEAGSPAEKSGLLIGDRILSVNGHPVEVFMGDLQKGVAEQIMLCETDRITFRVQRPGQPEPLVIVSKYEIPETPWWQRRQLPRVGISAAPGALHLGRIEEHSPADKAGLQPGDRVLSIGGIENPTEKAFTDAVKAAGTQPLTLTVRREDPKTKETSTRSITLAAASPDQPEGHRPILGVTYGYLPDIDETTTYPHPAKELGKSATAMWVTLSKMLSRKSKVGPDQLSSPLGIGHMMVRLAQSAHPWKRLLAFAVLLNVNLAILNLLPLPVLDGGHITMALYEAATRRPVSPRVLEPLYTGCALLLIGFILFVFSKDLGAFFSPDKPDPAKQIKFLPS